MAFFFFFFVTKSVFEQWSRPALGVSGGPDSMALCVLTAKWKTEGLSGVNKTDGFIDGLVAVVVDHGLRQESRDEAELVCSRVSDIGKKKV